MTNNENLIVGLIFTIIIGLGVLFHNNHLNSKEYAAKISAMEFAIKQYEEKIATEKQYEELQRLLTDAEGKLADVNDFKKIYKDLLTVKPYLRHLTLLLCNTESGNRYDVIHTGKYDSTTTGICGIKTHWIGMIPEINESNINSLYAGSLVIEYLLNKNGENVYAALKEFKGSIVNTKPVEKVMEMRVKYQHLKPLLAKL